MTPVFPHRTIIGKSVKNSKYKTSPTSLIHISPVASFSCHCLALFLFKNISRLTHRQSLCSLRHAIGHAIKNGSWKRFSAEDWKNLTKGRASEIIDQIRAKEGDPLASWGQKKRFLELVREGFLRGVKRETFKNLRNEQIKRMIYKGMKNKEAGTFAGPYLHPDDPTPAAA